MSAYDPKRTTSMSQTYRFGHSSGPKWFLKVVNRLDNPKSKIVTFEPNHSAQYSVMGWFLIRKKFCAYATLIAFLIQSVASFGHSHLEHIGTQSVAAGSVSTADSGKDDARAPFDGDSHEPAGYVCDICATLILASSAQISIPPALPTRFAFHAVAQAISAETAPARPLRVDFHSRAPPVA